MTPSRIVPTFAKVGVNIWAQEFAMNATDASTAPLIFVQIATDAVFATVPLLIARSAICVPIVPVGTQFALPAIRVTAAPPYAKTVGPAALSAPTPSAQAACKAAPNATA